MTLRKFEFLLGLAALGAIGARAQTASAPVPEEGAVTAMEKFTVSDVPVNKQILPTVRPVGSVMGDDQSVLDIARSVSTVNKAWMQDREVTNAMDFSQFSPGVYSPARYGVPATPQIRGDNAQFYVNGQQTLYTASSIFPSFNGVEAMDIVKGPGSAIYGPQSQAPGGYANLVTKQPYFDRQHTEIDLTLGTWASGKAYSNPEVTIDTGGPLTKDLAYRLSYLSRYGNGYYDNEPNQSQDLFGALTWHASQNATFNWWGQWYGNYFEDVTGVNRVTQAFIWHGTYVTGAVTAPPDSPPFGTGAVDGSFGVLNAATAGTTRLSPDKVLTTPGDSARTGRFQTQLTSNFYLSSASRLVNLTYFESANDRQLNQFGYDEYMPIQKSFQDRAEYHSLIEGAHLKNSLIAGADFRYTRIVAYQDYGIQPFFYFDLSKPSSTFHFPAYGADQKTFGGGFAVPGAPGYSAYLPLDSSNQDSHITDTAGFIQDELTVATRFSVVAGLRLDHIKADDGNPPLIQVMDPTTGSTYNPGRPVAAGSLFRASDTVNNPATFISLVFKPSETASFYVSYNRVNAIVGSTNFGGVNVNYLAAANFPFGTPQDYHDQIHQSLTTQSTLYEAGFKKSFLKNTLFVDIDIYQQLKQEPQVRGAPPFRVKASGVEFDTVFQPTKAFTFNANATYQNVTDFGSAFFQQTDDYLDGYPVGYFVDGRSGTGEGSPDFSAVPSNGFSGIYSPPGGRMKAPGVPQFMLNFFAQYQFRCGLGFGAGPQIQGAEYANDQDTLHIPSQYELDGFIFYRRPRWDVQVNLKNMTNQRLLDPVDVTFAGNDVIFVRPPISASVTFRYRF